MSFRRVGVAVVLALGALFFVEDVVELYGSGVTERGAAVTLRVSRPDGVDSAGGVSVEVAPPEDPDRGVEPPQAPPGANVSVVRWARDWSYEGLSACVTEPVPLKAASALPIGGAFAMSLWFRAVPHDSYWHKGTWKSLVTYSGPVLVLARRSRRGAAPSAPLRHEEPILSISVIPSRPTKRSIRWNSTAGEVRLVCRWRGRDAVSGSSFESDDIADLNWHRLDVIATQQGAVDVYVDGQRRITARIPAEAVKRLFADDNGPPSLFVGCAPDHIWVPGADHNRCGPPPAFRGQLARFVAWRSRDAALLSRLARSGGLSSSGPPSGGYVPSPPEAPWTGGLLARADASQCRGATPGRPYSLLLIGHLRTFGFTGNLAPIYCAHHSNPFNTVLVVPAQTLYVNAARRPRLAEATPPSWHTIRAWWSAVQGKLFPPSTAACSSLDVEVVSEADRAGAERALFDSVRGTLTKLGIDHGAFRAATRGSDLFLARVTQMLTAYRYFLLRRAHERALRRWSEAYGSDMKPHDLVVVSRPDMQFFVQVSGLGPVASALRARPDTVYGFWDPNDFFDDRVLITSRLVVDRLLRIDHACKWSATWLNASSALRMDIAVAAEGDRLWGGKGPVLLWDYLLDMELVATRVHTMERAVFGEYNQYAQCSSEPLLRCEFFAGRGRDDGCRARPACAAYPATKRTPFNMTKAAVHEFNFTVTQTRKNGVKPGYFPRVGRTNPKGYAYRRYMLRKQVAAELDHVRRTCVRRSADDPDWDRRIGVRS